MRLRRRWVSFLFCFPFSSSLTADRRGTKKAQTSVSSSTLSQRRTEEGPKKKRKLILLRATSNDENKRKHAPSPPSLPRRCVKCRKKNSVKHGNFMPIHVRPKAHDPLSGSGRKKCDLKTVTKFHWKRRAEGEKKRNAAIKRATKSSLGKNKTNKNDGKRNGLEKIRLRNDGHKVSAIKKKKSVSNLCGRKSMRTLFSIRFVKKSMEIIANRRMET